MNIDIFIENKIERSISIDTMNCTKSYKSYA